MSIDPDRRWRTRRRRVLARARRGEPPDRYRDVMAMDSDWASVMAPA